MSGDPAWGAVSLLLRGDGADGSTTIVDSSPVPKGGAAVGNARISTAQSRFGGSSLYFDGNGDYLNVAHNTALAVDSSDFTVESWIYLNSAATNNMEIASKSGKSGISYANWDLCVNSSQKLTIIVGQSGSPGSLIGSLSGATSIPVSAWVHVAATKQGTTYRVFVAGVLDGSAAWASVPSDSRAAALFIGYQDSQAAACYWNGYIDDLRITKGVARYTANFTPPAAPFDGAPEWWGGSRGIATSTRSIGAPQHYSAARPVRPSFTRADGTPGPGSIVGTVKVDALPVSRKVRLFDVATGRLLKEVWSDKAGVYRFDGLALNRPYTVLSHDHMRDYNATVADYVYAEVLP